MEELRDCAGNGPALDEEVLKEELAADISRFLESLSERTREFFLERYWFVLPLEEIARKNGVTKKAASMRLTRIREQLKEYLRKEGYDV